MGLWAGMKWVAREGSGAGVQRRLVRLILESPGRSAIRPSSLLRHFMAAATAAVTRFGPAWARREVLGQAVGVWLLVLSWLTPMALLVLMAVQGVFVRSMLGTRPIQEGTAVHIRSAP